MPLARGSYRPIAQEIERWRRYYPNEIRFYHLNAGDYQYFKSPELAGISGAVLY